MAAVARRRAGAARPVRMPDGPRPPATRGSGRASRSQPDRRRRLPARVAEASTLAATRTGRHLRGRSIGVADAWRRSPRRARSKAAEHAVDVGAPAKDEARRARRPASRLRGARPSRCRSASGNVDDRRSAPAGAAPMGPPGSREEPGDRPPHDGDVDVAAGDRVDDRRRAAPGWRSRRTPNSRPRSRRCRGGSARAPADCSSHRRRSSAPPIREPPQPRIVERVNVESGLARARRRRRSIGSRRGSSARRPRSLGTPITTSQRAGVQRVAHEAAALGRPGVLERRIRDRLRASSAIWFSKPSPRAIGERQVVRIGADAERLRDGARWHPPSIRERRAAPRPGRSCRVIGCASPMENTYSMPPRVVADFRSAMTAPNPLPAVASRESRSLLTMAPAHPPTPATTATYSLAVRPAVRRSAAR